MKLNIQINLNNPKDDEQRPGQVHKITEETPNLEEQIISDEFHRKYEKLEFLGEGGAAVVNKCRHKQSNLLYAAKIMRNYDVEKQAYSQKEFDLIHQLPSHPNIIGAKEFIVTESWTYTVLEYAEGQELQDFVNKQILSKDNIKSII